MLTDPQSITVNTVPVSLPRIAQTPNGFVTYADIDGQFALQISHDKGTKGSDRHVIKCSEVKPVTQPDGSSIDRIASVHTVITVPKEGFTSEQVDDIREALAGFLTNANVIRILGFES